MLGCMTPCELALRAIKIPILDRNRDAVSAAPYPGAFGEFAIPFQSFPRPHRGRNPPSPTHSTRLVAINNMILWHLLCK